MFVFLKKVNKIIPIVLVLIFIIGSLNVSAANGLQNPSYTNYYYEQSGSSKILVEDRPVYVNKTIITGESLGISAFYGIEDIYSENGLIYILDSAENRIVILNEDYSLNKIINRFTFGSEEILFSEPKGIYVSKDDDIYISDTENQRILICDTEGIVKNILQKPESDLIPDDFNFYPISVQIDKSGYFYVLTRGSYYGALMYNDKLEFVGFFGANQVSTTILEGISSFINSVFETSEKLANSVRKLPYQFYDFDIDDDGFIYTVSPVNSGQIKKLNLKGNNTLKYKNGTSISSAESFNFGDSTFYTDNTGHKFEQTFSAISVDSNKYIFALDSVYGKVYVYDGKCNNIAVLGGGVGAGNQIGTFTQPNAIETFKDDVLISDYARGNITVMSRTEYGELIMKANDLTNAGEFNSAEPLWKKVLTYNANRQLAYRGLAIIELNRENYDLALKYAKVGLDQETYVAAYEQKISIFMNDNLWWIFIVLVLLTCIAFLYFTKRKKKAIASEKNIVIRKCFGFCIHPIEIAQEIRANRIESIKISVLLLVIFYISTVLKTIGSGFMYVLPSNNYNLFLTCLGSVGIVLLWIICHWGVSTVFSGKASLKNILIITCYSLLPLIVGNILYIIFSYVVIPSSASFITVLQIITYIYFIALMIFGLINVQEYSLGKLFGVTVVSVLGMIAVAFIIFMLFMLGQNFVSFVVNIVSEAIYR